MASFDLDTGTFGADSDEVVGTIDLLVNLSSTSASPLSGSISNLAFEDDEKISGSVNLGNSTFDRSSGRFFGSGNNFDASLTGVLADGDGDTVTINGTLLGDFRSSGAADARTALDGFLSGTINADGITSNWTGEFTTLQQ